MKLTTSRLIALALAGSVLSGPLMADAAIAATKKASAAKPAAKPAQDEGLTRDEARAHAADIFDRLDFNHDGVFNAADGKARREARLGEIFDRIDANHDGSVTRAEFIAAHEERGEGRGEGPRDAAPGGNPPPPHGGNPPPPPPGADGHRGPGPDHRRGPDRGPGHDEDRAGSFVHSPMVFAILREADPQHTGTVTKDAFIAAELKRFDEADTNHDGKVTREELRAARHDRGWGPRREGWRHDGPHDGGPGHGPGHPPRDGDTPPPPPAPDAAK